jgi:hypothetical protein
MYVSWPDTLFEDKNLMMIQSEGSIAVLSRVSNWIGGGCQYSLYIDGGFLDTVLTATPIADYLWHHGCLYYWCPEQRLVGVYDPKISQHFRHYIPMQEFEIVSGSLTMYRANVAAIFTGSERYTVMVFFGEHGSCANHSPVHVGGQALPREDGLTYAVGLAGVPFSFAAFATVSRYKITIYNSEGPYHEYKATDTEAMALQSPMWQRANDLRRNSEHMSWHNWNLVSRIGKGTLSMKYSFDIPVPVSPVDWVQVYFDGQPIDPADFIDIGPTDSHEVKLKALRMLTNVEVRSMEPLHMPQLDGTYDSVMGIPFMKQGDEAVFQLSPVMTIPGHAMQRIIEKLNVRVRAEVW